MGSSPIQIDVINKASGRQTDLGDVEKLEYNNQRVKPR